MSEEKTHEQPGFQRQRLQSLDAYRGLIMISLAFVGFGLAATAENFLQRSPESGVWQWTREQFSHAPWAGCSYWDLIQPSFMFMVGVSMAFSYAKRKRLGASYGQMFSHATTRSVILILLSLLLISQGSRHTNWSFTNVLAQIGLAYPFLFLLWNRPLRTQAAFAALILAGTWAAYEMYPHAGLDLTTAAPEVGVAKQWAAEHLPGIRPPWHKNANLGHAVDLHLLNAFPRAESFQFHRGGYPTINFIPSLVTMLFGLMCGELLRSDHSGQRKWWTLVFAGTAGLAAGELLDLTGACPIVKRIWTPSWTLFSTGWCCLILASLYGVIDILGFRRWAFPLKVVGMNSIAVYVMAMSLKPWTARQWKTHFGENVFTLYGTVDAAIAPSVQAVMVGSVFWLICYWLYRQKIFIRI